MDSDDFQRCAPGNAIAGLRFVILTTMSHHYRPFGSTIRDFSKSKHGLEFLDRYFAFAEFPCPALPAGLEIGSSMDSGVLGTALDQIFLLVVERQNLELKSWRDTWQCLPDRRSADAQY